MTADDLWLELPLAETPGGYHQPSGGVVRLGAIDAVFDSPQQGSRLVVSGVVLWSPLAPDEVIARMMRGVAGASHPEHDPS